MNLLNIVSLLLSFQLVSCAGRQANVIDVKRSDDHTLSCQAIELETDQIQRSIRRLVPESEKTGKNIALGAAGCFLLVPWLFMDLSSAEKEEIEAYRQRLDVLQRLTVKKQCAFAL